MLVLRAREKPPPDILPRPTSALAAEIGRDERIRTSDPHTPSVMRYQAALRPDRLGSADDGTKERAL